MILVKMLFTWEWKQRVRERESEEGEVCFLPQDDEAIFTSVDLHQAWLTLIGFYLCITTMSWTLIKGMHMNRPPLSCPLIYSVYMPPGLSRPRTKPATAERPRNYQSISTSGSL